MKTEENKKKRLAVDLDINIHCEIKKRASVRNISITDYVLIALAMWMAEEDKYL
jgi:uncharacterized protein (DUF1778 family)